MKRNLRVLPEARDEIVEAFDHYAALDDSLAARFTAELSNALDFIQDFPRASDAIFDSARRINLRSFPYALFYFIDDSENPEIIVVFALPHQSSELAPSPLISQAFGNRTFKQQTPA